MTNLEFKLADAQCVNDNLPDMFSILYSNMNAIMPTGHSYEEDFAVWRNYAVPAMQQENHKVVFFYADGDLIGYFQYRLITESSTLFMEEMQIRAEFQGSGVFSAFYSWLVRQLPAGIQTVEALAGKPNQKSQAVLELLGLQNVGENHTGKSFHYKGEYARLLERYLNEKQV